MPDVLPRVSVLIPNYNNGVESSKDGQWNLIEVLLESLHKTLNDDPTPLEIIAFDDGSTDDSLATLRDWSQKPWRGGQPFLRLIEGEHCGVLSITANELFRQARGDILVRLDGDVQCLTPNWARKLCRVFDACPPRLGVVGPKQLSSSGVLHAFGDFVLHPKGYHHVGFGLDRYAVSRALEVDHVMGCFYCCRRAVWEEVGGFDEQMLRGQTVDLGLAARLAGWSCWAVPHIEFAHHHGLRKARSTAADSDAGVDKTLDYFRKKWGFCRIAPDLDSVRDRYAGTPLLWNADVFGLPPEEVAPQARPTTPEQTLWGQYAADERTRARVNLRVSLIDQVVGQMPEIKNEGGLVAVLGCGPGLLPHLLAKQGLAVAGTDTDAQDLEVARQFIESQQYPAQPPQIHLQDDPRRVPLDDDSAGLVVLCDVLERHRNPARLIAEAGRIIRPDGKLVVIAAQQPSELPQPGTREHGYHAHELMSQVMRAGPFAITNCKAAPSPQQPVILTARPTKADAAGDAARAA